MKNRTYKYFIFIGLLSCLTFELFSQDNTEQFEILETIFNESNLKKDNYQELIGKDSTFVIFQNDSMFVGLQNYVNEYGNSITFLSEPWIFYHDIQYFFVFDELVINEDQAYAKFHSTSRYNYSNMLEYIECYAFLKKKSEIWFVETIEIEKGKCCDW